MRPTYENKDTSAHQDVVARRLEEIWGGCDIKRLPGYYIPRFAVTRGKKLLSFLQIKCRTHAHDTYGTLMISAMKMKGLIEMASLCRKDAFLVAQWIDRLGYVRVDPSNKWEVEWGGRTLNTRDAQDVEPVFHIPVEDFKVIETPAVVA